MIRLSSLALAKILPYRSFWIVLGIYAAICLITVGIIFGMGKLSIGEAEIPLTGFFVRPFVWQNMLTIARLGNYFLSLVMILVVCNDFQYRILRQDICNGLSREESIGVYGILAFILSLLSAGLVLLMGALFSTEGTSFITLSSLKVFLVFLLQSFGFFTFSLLIAMLTRVVSAGIFLFLGWHIFLETMLSLSLNKYAPPEYSSYLPFRILNDLVPGPVVDGLMGSIDTAFDPTVIGVSAGYCVLFLFLSWARLKTMDL